MFEPDWKRTLEGEHFGAGFGYSLAKADTNGDGTPALVVGAPFHDGGGGRGGAIYLYLSKSASKNLNIRECVKVMGRERESQFGLAISSTGDLNRDGYEDFAVGSPYESGGRGAVYIFFGGESNTKTYHN